VTKFGVIIPICIIAVSGCALQDGAEVTSDATVASIPVLDSERLAPMSETDLSKSQPKAEPIRPPSMDDIRRLQMRLREFGFDPGPVDGVTGAKTKAAFQRLKTGCARLEPLPMGVQETSGPLNRDETIKLQSQLRSAGFNPGPVDGIFGKKTKSVIAQLPSGCLMAKELNGRLELAANPAKNQSPGAAAAEAAKAPVVQPPATAMVQTEAQRILAENTPARSQEEIRILQLRLRDAGFDPGPFDGVMRQKTKLALQHYEESQRNRKVKTGLTANTSGQY